MSVALFVLFFFLILLVTGLSLGWVFIALVLAGVLMLAMGFIMILFKLLPWILLAIAAVWLIRVFTGYNGYRGGKY